MLPEERRSRIAQRVIDEGAVSVSELSRLFGVAEETIRRDLKVLESAGRSAAPTAERSGRRARPPRSLQSPSVSATTMS